MSYNNLNLKSSPLTWKDVTYRRTTPCRLIVSLRSSSWFRTKNKIMLQTHISEYIRFDKASRFCVKSAFRGFNASKFLVKRVYIYVHVYLQRCPGLLNHLVFFHFQNQLLRELFFSKPITFGSEIDFSIPSRASLEETPESSNNSKLHEKPMICVSCFSSTTSEGCLEFIKRKILGKTSRPSLTSMSQTTVHYGLSPCSSLKHAHQILMNKFLSYSWNPGFPPFIYTPKKSFNESNLSNESQLHHCNTAGSFPGASASLSGSGWGGSDRSTSLSLSSTTDVALEAHQTKLDFFLTATRSPAKNMGEIGYS